MRHVFKFARFLASKFARQSRMSVRASSDSKMAQLASVFLRYRPVRLLEKRISLQIREQIRASGRACNPELAVRQSIGYMAVSVLVLIPILAALAVLMGPHMFLLLPVPAILLFYPRARMWLAASERKTSVDGELAYFALYASVMQSVGQSLYGSMVGVLDRSVFSAMEREAMMLSRNVHLFGMDQMSALNEHAMTHPNRSFGNLLLGYVSVGKSGGDLGRYMEEKCRELFQRDNYNILLLATSGAGKSVTAKTLLARLIKKYPTSEVFVVDPNGEYEAVANYLQIPIIKVMEGRGLGLDPFNLFRPEDAAEIVGDISKGDEVVRKEFRAKAGRCKSIKELYDVVDERAKSYLKDLVAGSLYEVLKGEMRIGGRVVISLRGTSGEERVSMLLLLVLGKIWKRINSLPASVPKILLVDEGWMLFNMSSAGKFLDMMARMGRKFNVIFIFVTQRPEDVIENRFGRAIAENAATKIFLQNTEQASERIQHTMGLSEEEVEMLKTFSRGQCLFLTKDYRLKVQITPSSEEIRVFSTTPMEM